MFVEKIIGKIIEFDGFSGTVIDSDKTRYIFSNDDLLSKDIKVNDIVTFEGESFKTVEVEINIARFVKKYETK